MVLVTHPPFQDSTRKVRLELNLEAHGGRFYRFERKGVVHIWLRATVRPGFDWFPLAIDLIKHLAGFWNTTTAGARIVEPVHRHVRNGFCSGKVILNPLRGATMVPPGKAGNV